MKETVSRKTAAKNTVKTAAKSVAQTAAATAADPVSELPDNSNTMLGTHPRSVFICSPYRPTIKDKSCRESELEANIDRAERACRIAVALGFLPLAPHLYFTRFLYDDNEQERETGMRFGMQWLEECDEVWVFGDRISAGMKAEIKRAKELGKNVRRFPEPGRLVELLLKELEKQRDRAAGGNSIGDGTEKTEENDTAGSNTADSKSEQPGAAESEE